MTDKDNTSPKKQPGSPSPPAAGDGSPKKQKQTAGQGAGGTKLKDAKQLQAMIDESERREAQVNPALRPHAFWDEQPVLKLTDAANTGEYAPLEFVTPRPEPYPLPQGFVWDCLDLKDDKQLEELHSFLAEHYIEDREVQSTLRFTYSKDILRIALLSPGFLSDWHIGVRTEGKRKLVAFISGTPQLLLMGEEKVKECTVNFLCVMRKLRAKRLAPVLIKELTRRVAATEGYQQAIYTNTDLLPGAIGTCVYWHRPLNFRKLLECQFVGVPAKVTISAAIRLFRVPDPVQRSPPFQRMEVKDAAAVAELLNGYLKKFRVRPHFTEETVAHWVTACGPKDTAPSAAAAAAPAANGASSSEEKEKAENGGEEKEEGAEEAKEVDTATMYCFVRKDKKGAALDFFSLYGLDFRVVGQGEQKHSHLRVAYLYYYAAGTLSATDLVGDAIANAKQLGYDVVNSLDALETGTVVKELKFEPGKPLHYYMYNYRCPRSQPHEIGMLLF
uniref:Glycylpeptide N-tetradecanoyltransferase n=1 Tax=Chromera velia CCMP2878 TaxID=1169474 RepID=A0A0G4GLL3_9ALVE|eukprot:Cvel_22438.t1-p1 / transcript=Cvel_22438.t1 / gene=Cvel_22438 / organism=Chromera_velia_CCMP2878 / gene_product=Glycylpeptide N-tetradecanoyltransferase 1, putative / transcript_product=Glycylpeptide N-tetradecanoyltransferase 1, putative / location=Cvel_scaffold2204:23675-30505(-) / protein_length=500 / sequence_SO=supercontig / SO=protein_coding / is_pseudo=false